MVDLGRGTGGGVIVRWGCEVGGRFLAKGDVFI